MRRLLRRLKREERGSSLVVVAIFMSVLLGAAALGTDMGRLYLDRERLSVLADAASLSGAQLLPDHPDQAIAVAQSYIAKNGGDASTATVTVSPDNHQLTVQLGGTVQMTFARFLGIEEQPVAAQAVAQTAPLSASTGAAPLGVPKGSWVMGDEVTLKMDADGGTISPGNYGALALGKSGSSTYEQNLMYGYGGEVQAGDWVDTEPGNMAGPTIRAVNYLISQDPYATVANHRRTSPRLLIIPILDTFQVNGRGQVLVVGFGVFFLESAVQSGNDKGEIIGRFVRYVTEGGSSLSAPDLGVYVTRLVR